MMVEMLSQQPFDVPNEIQDENDDRGWDTEEEEDDADSNGSVNDQHDDIDIEAETIEPDEEEVAVVDSHQSSSV